VRNAVDLAADVKSALTKEKDFAPEATDESLDQENEQFYCNL
jgi:hypothetical protein